VRGGAPEPARENREGIFQEAATSQIGEEPCDRRVDGCGVFGVVFGECAVLIPSGVGDLDKAYAGLRQAARHAALAGRVFRGLAVYPVKLCLWDFPFGIVSASRARCRRGAGWKGIPA
jgi:hypothetical protein